VNTKLSKSLATLTPYSTNGYYAQKARATTEGVLSDPSFVDSKTKISDEKRGNPKMQGAQKQSPPMKKRVNPKTQGAQKQRPPIKKRGNPEAQGAKKLTTINLLKPASPT
jgi:hypothetical protein